MNETVNLLAIESSCDDTGASVLTDRKVRSNVVSSQDIHEKYGGIVPELASRSHQKNIVPVVNAALERSGVEMPQLDAIAYTVGPGLPGSLIVGSAFAKSLALSLSIPLIEVNHMQAHIQAHFIEGVHESPPQFPFLCLTVSGGHTQMVVVRDHHHYEVIGQTLDDAAGEAFDKIAKMLGFPYPGGPLIDKEAKGGDVSRFSFSKPRIDGFDFSFSGLKTGVLYFLRDSLKQDSKFIEENLSDLCASVQHTIVEILIEKLELAANAHGINDVALAGGVSANSYLRQKLEERAHENDWRTFIPPIAYCTDNAAMIGISGYFKFLNEDFSNLDSVPQARLYL
jgi:N6-L-threonylcarbamoyladenine synthase